MIVSAKKLQANFGRAAARYDAHANFQHKETLRVLDAALMLFPEKATIADVGCGTGYFALAARKKRPGWKVMGIDIAPGMCAVARARCSALVGDAANLPLASNSVDALVSSLCYQWVENQSAAFAELTRVLKPGGRAVVASLGASTLQELRQCADAADLSLGLLPMRKFADCAIDIGMNELQVTLAESRVVTEYYPTVTALLNSMRAIGAGNNFANADRAAIAPKRFAEMVTQYEQLRGLRGIPATWEHHFFILAKPL